ncbi:MAG: ChaN family lipoprotein [Candidatus Cloacimonetes bacterium]|nr:ChaN family lipoprotein [Candidatus Cloacimonadota bacterium]
MRRLLIPLALLILIAPLVAKSWPEVRIYSADGEELSLAELTSRLQACDVVFFGEWHGHPSIQALQVDVFDSLAQGNGPLTLSLEMFERDQQGRLDSLRAGAWDYDTFAALPRTWSSLNHPLMRHALEEGSYIIAANVPRRLASRVAHEGTAWLDSLQAPESHWVADTLHVWDNDYQRRFFETMTGAPELADDMPPESRARIRNIYAAQCLKDDTMAWSIATHMLLSSHSRPRVLHICGDFHSRAGLGTVSRLRQRLPHLKIAIIAPIAVEDEELNLPESAKSEGDFLLVLPPPEPYEDAPRRRPMPGMN